MNRIPEITLAVTAERVAAYAELTLDHNPIHLDPDFAATTPFGQCIAHGTMALNLLVSAITEGFGPLWQTKLRFDIRFTAPSFYGTTLRTGGSEREGGWEVWVDADSTRVLSGSLGALTPPAGQGS